MIVDWERILWFKDLKINSCFYGSAGFPGRIDVDNSSFAKGVFAALQKKGVRRVAFINGYEFMTAPFLALVSDYGLETNPEWIISPTSNNDLTGRMQSYGYEAFLKLWSAKERPEALVVFPDSVCRGVIMGILSKGVRVPEELLVATHLNSGVDFPCPFPLLKSMLDPADMADAAMEQIRRSMQGLPKHELLVPFTFEEDL